MVRRILFLIFCQCWLLGLSAQTVTWSIPPTYLSLEEYGDVYKIRKNGKVGLVDRSGHLLVRPEYDSISLFNEQLALGLEIQSERFVVKAIISQPDYQLNLLTDRYYIQAGELYFSDRKLAVYDDRGRYGYLLPDGTLFIPCQYARGYPFYEGLACVYKTDGHAVYLKDDGHELATEIEYRGYVLLAGTSFNEAGEACVQARLAGTKAFVIDTDGRTLRETKISKGRPKDYVPRKPFVYPEMDGVKQSQDGIEPYVEGNLYGYVTSDDKKNVVLPQFTEATPFYGGYAKVKSQGKYGILQLQSGSFFGQLNKNKVRFQNGKGEEISYSVFVPSGYFGKKVVLTVAEGNTSREIPLDLSDGGPVTYSFVPTATHQETEVNVLFSLSADGLMLWKDEQKLSLEHIKNLPPVLSVPQVPSGFTVDEDGYVRADSDNKVDVYATITNRSSYPLVLSVTIDGTGVTSQTTELSVPPESSRVVSSVIPDVKERKPVKVVIKTSTGLQQSCVIKVKPFI